MTFALSVWGVNFENFKKIHYGLVFSVKLLGCANLCTNRVGAFRVIPKTNQLLISLLRLLLRLPLGRTLPFIEVPWRDLKKSKFCEEVLFRALEWSYFLSYMSNNIENEGGVGFFVIFQGTHFFTLIYIEMFLNLHP